MNRHYPATQSHRFADAQLATGVRLHYAEQGDPSGPALILLHGYTDSWFSWSEMLPHLSLAYHVFALDQRGHGDSDRPANGYDLDDFAADVLAFMDAARLPSATLVGHSMGSWVAQRAATIAPRRIERLVLIGTSLGHGAVVDELNAVAEEAEELGDPVPVPFIREFQASTIQRPVTDAFFEQVVVESLKLPARVWRATAAGWLGNDRWADPQRLRMPVLIVWGGKDAMMPRADQDALAATLPHAALTIYEGTGHSVHWEESERFARDLDTFMRGTRSTPAT